MNKSFLLKVCHNTIGKECICVVAVFCQYFLLNGEPTKIDNVLRNMQGFS